MNTQSTSNDQHKITLVLINHSGYYMKLATESIVDMQVEENLSRWWMRGYIDVKNEHDFIERGAAAGGRITDLENLDEKVWNKGKSDSLYAFRNDGTDLVFIRIELPEAPNDHYHQFSGTFNVYSMEDIDTTGKQMNKIKRLYIHDERYQRMKSTNLPWSTTSLTSSTPTEMRQGKKPRSVPTGQAVKHLLKLTLGDDATFPAAWDNGQGKTMFTSPSNYNAIDDLAYLMRDHVSSDDLGAGQGVIYFDRPAGVWRLVNLELLFHYAARFDDEHSKWLAGSLQTESFKLLSYPDVPFSAENEEHTRVPIGGDRMYQNYDLGHRSIINTLQFNEINSADNLSNVITTPVHMYNKAKKEFQIKQDENSIDSIYSKLTNVIEYTPRSQPDSVSALSVNIEATRKLNTNIKHVYTTVTDSDKKYLNSGINAAVYKSIMLSNAVEFTVHGHPSRGIGRFISIKAETNSINNFGSTYHDKVFGQYLVTSVVHRYAKNLYSNTIVGVKPYNYKPTHSDNESIPETQEQFDQLDVDTEQPGMSLGDFFNNNE